MAFALEKDMVDIVKSNIDTIIGEIQELPSNNTPMVASELSVDYRMIDLAVAIIDKDNLYDNDTFDQVKNFRHLKSSFLDILSVIYMHKDASIFLLKKELGLSTDAINIHIKKLLKFGLIKQISKFKYTTLDWNTSIPKSIISIELKLSRWEEALDQAIYNLNFSDYSYVALDEERLPSKKNIEQFFIESNVGLIYVSTNGNLRTTYTPKPNKNLKYHMCGFQRMKFLRDIANDNKKWNFLTVE